MKAKQTPHTEAKPGKDTIYVDVDDDITTIIDKVEAAKQKIVALVLPKRAATLQSIVNMRLLKRSADNASKNVVLITSEAALLPLAGAAGLHVAKNLHSVPEVPPSPLDSARGKPNDEIPLAVAAAADAAGEADEAVESEDELPTKLDYNRPVGELATAGAADEPESIDLGDEDGSDKKPPKEAKTSKNKRLAVPNFDKFRLLMGGGIAALILLIFFFIFAIKVWPHATITVKTSSTPVSANFTLTTSDKATALDETKGVIPSVLKTQDQTASQQVQATGQKNNGKKATGNVDFTAQVCAPNLGTTPSDIPVGTGVNSNGLNFITQERASFSHLHPSGSCINYSADGIDVMAQAGGAKYNLNNATFSVPGRSDVSGTGTTSSGTDNIVTVLSQSDVDAVKNKLTSQNSSNNNVQQQFEAQLGDQGYYIIPTTLKAADPVITASPDVGQEATNSTVTIKVTYSALVVGKKELTQAVLDQLNKQIDRSKEKVSDSDVLKGLSVSVQDQASPTVATLSISKETTAIPIINADYVRNQVKGKKTGEIRTIINEYPGVKSVDVHFSPFWVSHAPKSATKIKIVMQQVKSGG